jgi:primosomal protein N' (replication factor Y) (superfamily II helicase)
MPGHASHRGDRVDPLDAGLLAPGGPSASRHRLRGMAIAKVEPLTTARALRGPFDYRIPRGMVGVRVGSVLVVPFGRRRIHGLVVDVVPTSDLPPERLVEPLECLEQGVPRELVELGLWVAERYCSTPARGLALVLPPGTGTAGTAAGGRTRALLAAELTQDGRRALRPDGPRLGPRQHAALQALIDGPLLVSDLSARTRIGHAALKALSTRGLVTITPHAVERRPPALERGVQAGTQPSAPPTLSNAQCHALEAITPPLRDRRHEQLLLHGVTGSGKTEVYLRAAALALDLGRSAIVLVPEIALTPQTVRRFEERFGDRVAVLHSKLGTGERYDEWQRLRRGDARVCVGPRSAIFAPLRDVGLIVVDEEHDPAYKQESDPRYDARRVAARRAETSGAVLVCGSATPRPESWVAMKRLTLPERVGGGPGLPPVELLDMRGLRHALHPASRAALEEVRGGGKAIVLVSRRGWAAFCVCRSCGHAWKCPRCDVTLTLHRAAGGAEALVCHHCGHREPVPRECADCRSTTIARHGVGTQRLEVELAEALEPSPVFRLDADAARRKHGIAAVLDAFATARSGVLVGTQMVAQGHDFPEVELAIVQDADAALRFPDFRAEERTFSLVSQLAGRSGRGPRGGRVLVQSLDPEASCLRHAAAHDAGAFLEQEIARRRVLRYPPFSRLVRVVTAGLDESAAHRAAETVAAALQGTGLELLGPAPLFRLKDRHRAVLLLKARPDALDEAAIGAAVRSAAPDRRLRGVSFAVDVDPQ